MRFAAALSSTSETRSGCYQPCHVLSVHAFDLAAKTRDQELKLNEPIIHMIVIYKWGVRRCERRVNRIRTEIAM